MLLLLEKVGTALIYICVLITGKACAVCVATKMVAAMFIACRSIQASPLCVRPRECSLTNGADLHGACHPRDGVW